MGHNQFWVIQVNCSKHEAQPLRNDVCLTLLYNKAQWVGSVTTNVDITEIRKSAEIQSDKRIWMSCHSRLEAQCWWFEVSCGLNSQPVQPVTQLQWTLSSSTYGINHPCCTVLGTLESRDYNSLQPCHNSAFHPSGVGKSSTSLHWL